MGAVIGVLLTTAERSLAADDITPTKAPPGPVAAGYDWSGFYAGGHLGVAWGTSNWTASAAGAPGPPVSGSFGLFEPINSFSETGSFLDGMQAGYNMMLPNRFVVGAEADASFPSFKNVNGISIGGTSTLFAPGIGAESFSETMLSFGTLRGRIGYAPGSWLFYATGGFAWAYDQLRLTQAASGASASPFLWRFGWAAGAGVEVPVAPHWTARLEYLFTDYGVGSVTFPATGQRFSSDFSLQELRAGLNYRFGSDAAPANIMVTKAPATPDFDDVNFHGQTTFVWQGYPAFRSAFAGPNSFPSGGEGRETFDATLFAGVRPWRGAELWINPEIDQGFGLADVHGVGRISERRSLQARRDLPLRARAALFRAADHRSRRRNAEGGRRHQSVRRHANREPLGADGRQIHRRRHLRHQQIRQQSQERFPELVADQCRQLRLRERRLGLSAMAPPPNGTRAALRYAAGCST